ncbi:recombinase family protein [Rhodoligotrophos appendicifer]|uniref:recombinase family protein n=1 Tax=Rhodoligotrophos appendicifer TaxID=987056 RepID=UPI002482A977|nr:recombinase family protein [Rhodoligotrophos appendicifer]
MLNGSSSLDEALAYLRKGDTLVVTKVDRLARTTANLWGVVQGLEAKGVSLRILNLGGETIDTGSATARLILNIFSEFAQFEREMMLERRGRESQRPKGEGKYKGRKPTARAKATEARALYAQKKTHTEIAKALGISRASVYRALAEVQ